MNFDDAVKKVFEMTPEELASDTVDPFVKDFLETFTALEECRLNSGLNATLDLDRLDSVAAEAAE